MTHIHTAPTGSLPVLDLNGACEFLELTYEEIMLLLPQAMIEIREKFDQIRRELDSVEQPGVMRHAHTIKSVAGSIGAMTVQRIAEDLERHAKNPVKDHCSELAARLEREIAHLTEAVAALP